MDPLRIGIVGLGNISGIYFRNLLRFPETTIVAVADLDQARAKEVAEKNGIAKALTTEELLQDGDVELVLNLTIPRVHAEIAMRAMDNGKHVYSEKPLGINQAEGQAVLKKSIETGMKAGCAPDTFMGSGIQTCRKLIDDGAIGTPIAGNAFMLCRGHESWHPSPEFYYELGGGPMLDMGPYYISALVNLLGSVKRVTASTRASFDTRTITSQPKAGKTISVETPTHMVGVLDFESGPIVQLTTSFDVYPNPMPNIVIYGSEGTLIVPDPNGFGGEPQLKRAGEKEWTTMPLTHGFVDNARGVGVLDMAYAIRDNTSFRADVSFAAQVLEVMTAYERSSDEGRHIQIETPIIKPPAMAVDEYAAAWTAIKPEQIPN